MSADTVITPFSWSGPAVELANRTWRKKVLPIGDVQYQGRMLHFTEDYLSGLCEAFRDGAYDQVSFQLADARNTHTNDPERYRGTITDLQLEPDGLYALAQVTEAGERVLAENPMLGVSARIVEHYQRSDGKYFPAAIQHVLGTLDPRIPQLGSWSPVDMANDGELLIDLSQSAWDGEPGPAYDLAASAVGARIGANFPAGSYDDIDAVIAASLPQDDGYAGLAEFGRTFELANATELARLEQDAAPPAVRSEDRMAAALERIAAGTYTPHGPAAYGFASPGEGTVTGMPTCGPADDLGYCMERYHAPGCGSAATPDITEALRPELEQLAMRPYLGEDGHPWHDRQFGSPMTLTDHLEALTGQRLGDASLWETGRSKREVATVQRPQVLGDPDDPDIPAHDIPAGTARTAAALAAQSGISTSASHQAQQAAWRQQHARQAARYRGPRHPDYVDHVAPARPAVELASFGDEPLHGSLQAYSRAGAA